MFPEGEGHRNMKNIAHLRICKDCLTATRLACSKQMVQLVKALGASDGFLNNSLDRTLAA